MPTKAKREVRRYERRAVLDPPGTMTWLAMLSCGHKRKLSSAPERGLGPAERGRFMVCDDCTRLENAEGA